MFQDQDRRQLRPRRQGGSRLFVQSFSLSGSACSSAYLGEAILSKVSRDTFRNHPTVASPSGRWLRVEASGEIGAAIDAANACCEPVCVDVLTNENTALVVPR